MSATVSSLLAWHYVAHESKAANNESLQLVERAAVLTELAISVNPSQQLVALWAIQMSQTLGRVGDNRKQKWMAVIQGLPKDIVTKALGACVIK